LKGKVESILLPHCVGKHVRKSFGSKLVKFKNIGAFRVEDRRVAP
jgi:hypothetical protein